MYGESPLSRMMFKESLVSKTMFMECLETKSLMFPMCSRSETYSSRRSVTYYATG